MFTETLFLARKILVLYVHKMYIDRQKMLANSRGNILLKKFCEISSIKQLVKEQLLLVYQLLKKKHPRIASYLNLGYYLSIEEEG